MLRDVMKVLKDPGVVLEGLWPYIPNKVLAAPPNFPVSDRAYKITNYARLRTTDEMLNSLNAGLPFILGFDVYDSFDGEQIARTGIMTYPAADEAYLGGHAVLVVGYDTEFAYNADLKRSWVSHVDTGPAALLIRNSWGKDWGLDGHFWMPLDYPDDSSDVWAATVQEPIT
jgi:C1A family cysteine protease